MNKLDFIDTCAMSVRATLQNNAFLEKEVFVMHEGLYCDDPECYTCTYFDINDCCSCHGEFFNIFHKDFDWSTSPFAGIKWQYEKTTFDLDTFRCSFRDLVTAILNYSNNENKCNKERNYKRDDIVDVQYNIERLYGVL